MSICGDTVLVFNGTELGKLQLTILEGKNLPAADSNGLSDPYVEIKSEKGLFVRDGTVKTSVRSATLNPKWNQAFDLSWNHQFRKLVLRVYDHDKWSKDDFLGKARISYQDLCDQAEHDMWLPLYKTRKNKESAGEIHIKFKATSKIPLVNPPNFLHLEFTRREKDQDIMFEFGWDLQLPIQEGTCVRASILGLDYRYKSVDRFAADYMSGNLGACIQYVKDKLTDDEEVGSGENFFIQLQKLSLDIKYLVACVHIPSGAKSLSCIKGAFVKVTKDAKKNSGRTLAFHRIGDEFTQQGVVLAVIKRSYNGQWVFTSAAHPVTGSSSEESASQVTNWAKEFITP